MKLFKPVRFTKDNKAASVPTVWLIKTKKGYKCWWPTYGLNKKLRNCVQPPLEVDANGRKEWKLMDCVVLSDKGIFLI